MPFNDWFQPACGDNLLPQLLTTERFIDISRAQTVFGIRDHRGPIKVRIHKYLTCDISMASRGFQVYKYPMPIRPRRSHPLRTIRTVLGKTQAQFGTLVGTSAITIKRVENGSLALSDKLAARISAATGSLQVELLKGAKGKALSLDQSPYTIENFKHWNQVWNRATSEVALQRARELSEFVELLCLAAVSGQRSSLRSVYTALVSAVDEVCRDHRMDAGVTRMFEETGLTVKPLPQGGQYTVINPSLSLLVENAYYRLGKPNPGFVTTP